jgi:hypothetical protein
MLESCNLFVNEQLKSKVTPLKEAPVPAFSTKAALVSQVSRLGLSFMYLVIAPATTLVPTVKLEGNIEVAAFVATKEA